MSLRASLNKRPVIYEIVPPRRDTSRYQSELRGVEDVLGDRRISAINVPELTRRQEGKHLRYVPVTIPPEEYALMIKEYKESVVNVIAPRLTRDEFLARARRILSDYGIPNMVIVGKERREDVLPGPGVPEALGLLAPEKGPQALLGGICIFDRESVNTGEYGLENGPLTEAKRVRAKARAGCSFVTSQISFDPAPVLRFLSAYQRLCEETGDDPVTVFISLTTVQNASILALVESLDAVVPREVKRRLERATHMGKASVEASAEVFANVVSEAEKRNISVPLGLQVEQVGINSGELALELLDRVYPSFR